MFQRIGKGIKRFVEEKMRVCKEVLSCAQNRLILGLIFIGLGGGLVASAYLRVED